MKRTWLQTPVSAVSLCLMMVMVMGCSGGDETAPPREMGKVTGKVTLDGKPLTDAEIIFTPVDGGGSSSGGLDAEGKYSLEYSGGGRIGAVVGKHTVAFRDNSEDIDATGEPLPGGGDGGMGTVPEQYTEGMSTITREVATGEQVIDLELTSK